MDRENTVTRDANQPESAPTVYNTFHDWAEDGGLETTIIEAITELEGIPSEECPPLYEAVDPEALTELFRPGPNGLARMDGLVSFHYAGYVITIRSSGEISVEVSDPPA